MSPQQAVAFANFQTINQSPEKARLMARSKSNETNAFSEEGLARAEETFSDTSEESKAAQDNAGNRNFSIKA